MKTNTLIHRYLFSELVPPFAINLAFFTFIFLTSQILDITNLVVNHDVGLLQVSLVIVYAIPYFMVFVIPMAVMMAVLLTFMRLSGDNEIVALKAGGVNVTSLLPPVAVFCPGAGRPPSSWSPGLLPATSTSVSRSGSSTTPSTASCFTSAPSTARRGPCGMCSSKTAKMRK